MSKYMFNISKILTFVLMSFFLLGFFDKPKRDRFLIPEGFQGTVYVFYEVAGAPQLTMEDGFRLVVVPDSGIIKTSSEIMGGKLKDEYWLYSGEERRPMPMTMLQGGSTTERTNSSGDREIYWEFNIHSKE